MKKMTNDKCSMTNSQSPRPAAHIENWPLRIGYWLLLALLCRPIFASGPSGVSTNKFLVVQTNNVLPASGTNFFTTNIFPLTNALAAARYPAGGGGGGGGLYTTANLDTNGGKIDLATTINVTNAHVSALLTSAANYTTNGFGSDGSAIWPDGGGDLTVGTLSMNGTGSSLFMHGSIDQLNEYANSFDKGDWARQWTGSISAAVMFVTLTPGQFIGNGAGLTNVPAASLTGAVAQAALPADAITNFNAGAFTLSTNFTLVSAIYFFTNFSGLAENLQTKGAGLQQRIHDFNGTPVWAVNVTTNNWGIQDQLTGASVLELTNMNDGIGVAGNLETPSNMIASNFYNIPNSLSNLTFGLSCRQQHHDRRHQFDAGQLRFLRQYQRLQ